jgi:hypothetical protein
LSTPVPVVSAQSLVASDIALADCGIGPTSMEDRIAEAHGAQASIRQPSSENANESRCLVTMRPDPQMKVAATICD